MTKQEFEEKLKQHIRDIRDTILEYIPDFNEEDIASAGIFRDHGWIFAIDSVKSPKEPEPLKNVYHFNINARFEEEKDDE